MIDARDQREVRERGQQRCGNDQRGDTGKPIRQQRDEARAHRGARRRAAAHAPTLPDGAATALVGRVACRPNQITGTSVTTMSAV